MLNPFRYGNKAALVVGIIFMLLDNWPLAHEYGAWPIGCLFCFWYSATAVFEDPRLKPKVKYGLFAYLIIVLGVILYFHGSEPEGGGRSDWSLPPALKSIIMEHRRN